MPAPVVTLDTPDSTSFSGLLPTLEFTGVESADNDISYELNIYNSTFRAGSSGGEDRTTAMAFGDGVFILAHYGGSILRNRLKRSTDGSTWTDVTAASSFSDYIDIQYINGAFYAVSSSHLARSVDGGLTWAEYTGAGGSTISYGNGLYVIGTSTSNTVKTSPDGVTWTTRSMIASRQFPSIRFGNGIFLAVGNSGTNATSVDGINWTENTPVSGNPNLGSLAYVNTFVAVASNGTRHSFDGTTGLRTSSGSTGVPQQARVREAHGYYYCLGRGSTGTSQGMARRSPDGVAWEDVVLHWPDSGSNNATAVAYGNNMLVLGRWGADSLLIRNEWTIPSSNPGFSNTIDPGDTDPFTSGDMVRYESPDPYRSAEYAWRARGRSAGDNALGAWSATRTFTTSRPPNPGIFMQFLT